jgi:ABC-2 type transport system ATP-binding protein
MPVAIELDNVTVFYRSGLFRRQGTRALTGISLQVNAGEVCAFLGPNGAGKTTTINALMGFLFPESGKLRVLGYEPGDVRAKRDIGFLPENFAFHKYLTAEKVLRLHLALAGPEKASRASIVPELLAKVKLDAHANVRIGKFSRGMMQRVGLAQALLHDPSLFILDEPTSGLDPAGRREVRELILALKASGKTVFLSSHILSEIEQVSDRVVIIDHGQVKAAGRMADMLDRVSRAEFVVDRVSLETESEIQTMGGSVTRFTGGAKVTIEKRLMQETAGKLWAAGCEISSMNVAKSTLEDVFLQLVGEDAGGAE